MNESSGVQIVNCLGHLIEDVLAVSLSQDVLPDQREKVDVHVLKHEVNVPVVLCSDDFFEFDDVGVGELHQEHDFSIGALCVSGVIEGVEVLLESLYSPCSLVCDFPHVPVCSTADLLVDLEPAQHMCLNLFTH